MRTYPARHFDHLTRDDRGLSTVEYVILLILIAAAAVGAWQLLGGTIKAKLYDSNTTIRNMEGEVAAQGQGQSPSQGASKPNQTANNPAADSPAAPVKKQAAGKVAD